MSPVIQATGRRIVHNWVWLHSEDADRWKHQTLGQRDRLSWLTRLGRRESRHHQASAPLVTVIVITSRAR